MLDDLDDARILVNRIKRIVNVDLRVKDRGRELRPRGRIGRASLDSEVDRELAILARLVHAALETEVSMTHNMFARRVNEQLCGDEQVGTV